MSDPAIASSRPAAFVVAGMHRSGTSAMARVLSLAGAAMPSRVIAAGKDNPRGFWEPRDMVALNDEILRVAGYEWNDVFSVGARARIQPHFDAFLPRARNVVAVNYGGAAQAVLKDPRASLVSNLWRAALEAEGFAPVLVIMVRHPMEVARSIAERDGAPTEASYLAWLSHMVAIERDTRDAPRIFVSYDNLLNDWRGVVEAISQHLKAPLTITDDGARQINAFLSGSERHHSAADGAEQTLSEVLPAVAEAWRWAVRASESPDNDSEMPSSVTKALALLEHLMGPVLAHQRDLAARDKLQLQGLLGDREILRLRAEARVGEYQDLTSDLTRSHLEEIARRESFEAGLSNELAEERQTVAQLSTALQTAQTSLDRAEAGAEDAARAASRLRNEMEARLSLQHWFALEFERAFLSRSVAAMDAVQTELCSKDDEAVQLTKRFDTLSEAFSYLESEHRALTSASIPQRIRSLLHDLWPSFQ